MFALQYYPIDNSWFYLVVAFILEALAVYLWQYRQSPGALPVMAGLLSRVFWLFSLVMINDAATLQDKLFWAKFQQTTVAFPMVFWLVFILEITGQRYWLTKRTLAGFLLVPVIALLLMLTNDWHGWYWQVISLDGAVLTIKRGFGNWLMVVYSLVMGLFFLGVSGCLVKKCTGLRRRHLLIVTLAPASALIGAAIWFVAPHARTLPPLPFTSLIAGILWTYGFVYLRVISLLPLAQAAAVDIMGSGLAVIDTKGWMVDLNAAGAETLGISRSEILGKYAAEVVAGWPELVNLIGADSATTQEICLQKDNRTTYYELHIVKLNDQGGQMLGKAFIWKNITTEKQARLQLLEQEKALSILTERNRIGREFHDGPGQLGSYLQMELQTILVLLEKGQLEQAKVQTERLLGIARQFNVDVREAIVGLKMGNAANPNFLVLLEEYLVWYKHNYGVEITLSLPKGQVPEMLDSAAEVQLFWIIREAVNNIRKHAGAKSVQVSINADQTEVVTSIADDGRGFDQEVCSARQGHFGFAIMQERAQEAGGLLWVESKPGGGTKVTVKFPVKEANQ